MSNPEKKQKDKFLHLGICRWPFCVAVVLSQLLAAMSFSRGGMPLAVTGLLALWGPVFCAAGGLCAVINCFLDRGNRKRWGIEIAAFASVFILANLIMLPVTGAVAGHPSARARLFACASNLKQIGMALACYAGDNGGFLPPEGGAAGLDYLRRGNYLTDYRILTCPATATASAKEGPFTEECCDYTYHGEPFADGKETVVIADKPGNHAKGHNILYSSGRVESIWGVR